MVRQDVQGFEVTQPSDKPSQSVQEAFIIGYGGNHHMADPYGYFFLIQIPGKTEDIVIRAAGQILMAFGINMFNVQHDQIGHSQKNIQLFHPFPVGRCEWNSGGVDTGVDIILFGQRE